MQTPQALDPILVAQARTIIARLELVSHGRTTNLGPQGGNDTALYPPGGIARRDDREPDQPHKSHLHYQARLHRCATSHDVCGLISDAEATLDAWQHTPRPSTNSEAWKEMVAKDTRKAAVVAADWNVKKEYVWMLRRRYGTNGQPHRAAA